MKNLYNNELSNRLNDVAEANCSNYLSAEPYPHCVLDNFLPEEFVNPVIEKFPNPEELKWQKFNDPLQKKLAFTSVEKLDPELREFIHFFNSSVVLQFLERLTGIKGL